MLDAGENVGAIERKGAYYYFNGEKLGQGREKAIAFMDENPEIKAAIEADTRKRLAERLAIAQGSSMDEGDEIADDEDAFFGDEEELESAAR